MPTLLEVQHAVGAFLTRGDAAAAELLVNDGLPPGERLQIYRNTYIANLVGALRISYPAVRRLVGEEFFEGAARAFIEAHPPRTGYLNAYGSAFGDFLAQFPAAAALGYLPDVARLEWAVNLALHAIDVAPLAAARLMTLSESADVRFAVDPSVSLLDLQYSADAIWRAVIEENDDALGCIDPSDGPIFVLAERRNDAVMVTRISERDWRFASALFAGVALSRALADAGENMSAALAEHLAAGRFIDVDLCDFSTERTEP